MPRYRVTITHGASFVRKVEAANKDEAIGKASQEGPGGLCHQCAHEYSLSDPIDEFDDVEEI